MFLICSSFRGVKAQQRSCVTLVFEINNFPLVSSPESLPEQTYKDDSDAATLRQTLPDLTPDDPSDAPALPAEDSTSAPAPATADVAEGEEAAEAGDQEGDESPSKSPSKKKKKFRTPSFLKKNKKKTES